MHSLVVSDLNAQIISESVGRGWCSAQRIKIKRLPGAIAPMLSRSRRLLFQNQNCMDMVWHDHKPVNLHKRISTFQLKQLFLCNQTKPGILVFGGSKPPPYDARKQAFPIVGTNCHKVETGTAIVILFQPGVFSFGQFLIHLITMLYRILGGSKPPPYRRIKRWSKSAPEAPRSFPYPPRGYTQTGRGNCGRR